MKPPHRLLFFACAASHLAAYSIRRPIIESTAWAHNGLRQRMIVPGLTGVSLWILASAFALGQVAGPPPVPLVIRRPMPPAHLYFSFLLGVNHNDRLAEQHKEQGRNAELSRNFLQNELGFTDQEFAPIRATAQLLEEEIRGIDARIRAINGSREAAHRLPPELKALRLQQDAWLEAEVYDLQRALGPRTAKRLNSYVQNHFLTHYRQPVTAEDRHKDSLRRYGIFLMSVNSHLRTSAGARQAREGWSNNVYSLADYQRFLRLNNREFTLVCQAAQRLEAKNKELFAARRAIVEAPPAILPSPELTALKQRREALIEKEVSGLQRTLGPDLSARLDKYLDAGLHSNEAATELDSGRDRVFESSTAAQQNRRPGDPISPDYRIYSLQIDGMSMIGALLTVGRQLHIPMGIRYLDRDAVQKRVSVRLHRQKGKVPPHFVGPTLATALNAILAVGVDYVWNIRGTVVAYYGTGDDPGPSYRTKPFGSPIQIDNRRAQWPSRNLLNFRLAKFKIPKCTVEEASHRLEVALNAALNPGAQGVMGDHYPETGKNMVGPLTLRRHTVADILDKLVAKEKNAAWVVQVPPEAVDRLAPEGLWRVIEYDDPAFDQAVEAVKKNILRYPVTDSSLNTTPN